VAYGWATNLWGIGILGQSLTDRMRSVLQKGASAWLWDCDLSRIVWASEPAVFFWQEPTLLDLIERSFGPQDVMAKRLNRIAHDLSDTPNLRRRIKFNPDNRAVWALCHLQLFSTDGRRLIFVELEHIEETPPEDPTSGDIVMAQEAPVALAFYAVDGQLIHENDESKKLFDDRVGTDLMARLDDKIAASKFVLRVLADGAYSKTLAIKSARGERLHRLAGKRTLHPAQGVPALVVHIQDVHDTRQMWRERSAARPPDPEPQQDLSPQSPLPIDKRFETLSAFLNTLPAAAFLLNTSGYVTELNRAAKGLLKIEDTDIESLDETFFPALFGSPLRSEIEDAIRTTDPVSGQDILIRDAAGALAENIDRAHAVSLSMTKLSLEGPGQFLALVQDQTAQYQIQKTLMKAHDEVLQRDQQKLEYIARISHDMRTPLNAILGFSQIMQEERLGPIANDRYKEYLGDIQTGSRFLLSLVNDLLDYSKLEGGKLDLDPVDVDLSASVQSALNLMRVESETAQITLESDVDQNLPHIVADERSVQQMLLNLLSNAVKYCDPGDRVLVSAHSIDNGSVILEVRDTGPGMSPEDLSKALEPFQQTRTAKRKGQKTGTGLGLPITKALADANHADFVIESEEGDGTWATIMFPSTLVLA